jgi:phospholipase/lecithinase/hemolysin
MRRFNAAAVLVTVLTASPAAAQTPDAFFVFGDSLADNGNVLAATLQAPTPLPPTGAYCQGRFSNGPVAFEFVWAALRGVPLPAACPVAPVPGGLQPFLVPGPSLAINFAFGAATTEFSSPVGGLAVPGLKGQVALFQQALGGQAPPPNALYAILAGANDYLSLAAVEPSQEERVVHHVVGNIVDAIQALHSLGARRIIVVNVPDLGLAPLTAANPIRRASLSRLAARHNRLLAARLAAFNAARDGLDIVDVDLTQPLQALPGLGFDVQVPALDRLLPPPPELGGLPMSFCIFVAPEACGVVADFNAVPPSLFWDAEHPTTQAHYVLAQYILFRLQAP